MNSQTTPAPKPLPASLTLGSTSLLTHRLIPLAQALVPLLVTLSSKFPGAHLTFNTHTHTHVPKGVPRREPKLVKVLYPPLDEGEGEFEVGPALFGPDLGENEFQVCTTQDTSV